MKRSIVLACLMFVSGFALAKEKNKESSLPDASLSQVRWGEVINDVSFDKESLVGKVVVVEVWGMKCEPCLASLPDMAKLSKSNAKKGLIVVGLECQNSPKDGILKVLKKNRIEYPVMAGGSAPGSTGTIPRACVFNKEGKLVWNGNPHDEGFERAVKKELRAIKQ